LTDAAVALESAIDRIYAERRVRPFEFGGQDGTAAITRAVIDALKHPVAA
jgi:3-isopropylmalate dehydrogenase